jgi:hypothetical protein
MLAPAEVFSAMVLAGISTLGLLTGLTMAISSIGWLVGLGVRRQLRRRRPLPPNNLLEDSQV